MKRKKNGSDKHVMSLRTTQHWKKKFLSKKKRKNWPKNKFFCEYIHVTFTMYNKNGPIIIEKLFNWPFLLGNKGNNDDVIGCLKKKIFFSQKNKRKR